MKKSQLWKQILTGSLVLALTVTNVTPVMAAEIQPEGSSVATENVGSRDLQDETSETDNMEPKTDVQVSEQKAVMPEEDITAPEKEEAPEAENQVEVSENGMARETAEYAEEEISAQAATVNPSITNFRVTPVKRSDSSEFRFKLTYAVTDCDSIRLKVTDRAGKEVYSRYYETSDSGYFWDENDDEYNYNYNTEFWINSSSFDNLTAGMTYTFTLTPSKTVYNEEDDYDEEVSGTPATVYGRLPDRQR